MAAHLVRFESVDGAFMWVELTGRDVTSDIELVAKDSDGHKAIARLEDSLASVQGAAVALTNAIAGLEHTNGRLSLSEASLELALAFGIEGSAIVAKGSAHAQASVRLTWQAPGTTAPEPR